MRKVIRRSTSLSLLLCGALVCLPGRGVAEEYPVVPPVMEIFSGIGLVDATSAPRPSFADLPAQKTGEAATDSANGQRQGSRRPVEYGLDDEFLLLGGRIEAYPFPQRLYLEGMAEGDDHWFGEIQHSYKDLTQFRLISRRFTHALDNSALYDFDPALTVNQVERRDIGKGDYGLTIDMDRFKLRLKTPDFPCHLYTEGELIRRVGDSQLRFLGGTASQGTGSNVVRVSQARPVNESSKELTLGANSHLRWLEADLAHSWQEFESQAEASTYSYLANTTRDAGTFVHNQVPELKADKTTLKVHTTQTGRIFAAATVVDLERRNETSGAKVEQRLGHGDLMWTPLANLSLGTKYRHLAKDSSGPAAVDAGYALNGVPVGPAPVRPGVEGGNDSLAAFVRYTPVTPLTLKGQYSIAHQENDEGSAILWHLAEEKTTDTLELGAAWKIRHDLRAHAKYINRDTAVDAGPVAAIFNSEPEKTRQYTADLTYTPTATTSVYLSALRKEDQAGDLSALETTTFAVFVDPVNGGVNDLDATWQRYLVSVTQSCSERVSVTMSYTYSLIDTGRDFGISSDGGAKIVDAGYGNTQVYHNLGLASSWQLTDRLSLETQVDYTLTNGDYSLTQPVLLTPLAIADISMVDTHELGLRLDGEYALGQGWKAGVVLRYVDWIDKSFDNPGDGDMYGALIKLSRVFK